MLIENEITLDEHKGRYGNFFNMIFYHSNCFTVSSNFKYQKFIKKGCSLELMDLYSIASVWLNFYLCRLIKLRWLFAT